MEELQLLEEASPEGRKPFVLLQNLPGMVWHLPF